MHYLSFDHPISLSQVFSCHTIHLYCHAFFEIIILYLCTSSIMYNIHQGWFFATSPFSYQLRTWLVTCDINTNFYWQKCRKGNKWLYWTSQTNESFYCGLLYLALFTVFSMEFLNFIIYDSWWHYAILSICQYNVLETLNEMILYFCS